jgi:AraC family transcriptional regulator, transcriptional activator of pobA
MLPQRSSLPSRSISEVRNVSDLYRHFHFASPLHADFDIRDLDNLPLAILQDRIPQLPSLFYLITFFFTKDNLVIAEIKKAGNEIAPLTFTFRPIASSNPIPSRTRTKFVVIVSDNILPEREYSRAADLFSSTGRRYPSSSETTEETADTEVLENVCRSILIEWSLRKGCRPDLLNSHIQTLLLYLRRINPTTTTVGIREGLKIPMINGSLAAKFYRTVKDHISTTDINEEAKTVDFYARQLLVHPNYLSAVLKKSTGESPSTFIHQQIIEKAKMLLLHTEYSAKEIAYRLAFRDPAHFNTFFRKHTHQTPINYRSRQLKSHSAD